MRQQVWKNKSNGQLCITIPKTSGMTEGDFVEVKSSSIKKVAYCGVVGDLFHYGHLQSLQFAKSVADYLVAGIFTDEVVEQYRAKTVCNLHERKAVFQNLQCVDRVMIQHSRDPTENLKSLHDEFPDAEIILVHGDDLNYIHGSEYIAQIRGKILKHPYYARLSNFKIVQHLLEQKDKFKDITSFTSYIDSPKLDQEALQGNKIIISSKADTLQALSPLLTKSKIEPLYSFTISDWKIDPKKVLAAISQKFSPHLIVVRSSSIKEDTLEHSMAGYFESILNVDSSNQLKVEEAIRRVLASYTEKNAETAFNQILVQRQTMEIMMSGVVFTRTLGKNGPYYVINYDDTSGSSDSVTSGKEGQTITISHTAAKIPPRLKQVLEAVQEIEQKIPYLPLDIEFAVTAKNEVVIFQVRPLAANIHAEKQDRAIQEHLAACKEKFKTLSQRQPHLAGAITYFGDMPDWNPAEIIGHKPHHLDYSLYDYIITNSAWHEARTSQGYYNVNPAKLVEQFAHKPYVNVRNTFNSFTPASLPPALREKLVNFYLEKLKKKPYLQDKVEFEVLYTCYDLMFDTRSQELLQAGFTPEEVSELKKALLQLTNTLLRTSSQVIREDMEMAFSLDMERREIIRKNKEKQLPAPLDKIAAAQTLLDQCRKKGTAQFSRLARLGFIAKILLKSMIQRTIISQEFYDVVYASISTIATKISDDFSKLLNHEMGKEEFLSLYYHLRPGTYDITSPRYDANPDLLRDASFQPQEHQSKHKIQFHLSPEDAAAINLVFQREGLQADAVQFIEFVRTATEFRELSKFEFTKNVSEALELIAAAGEEMGFHRKEMAMLDIQEIIQAQEIKDAQRITEFWKKVIREREQHQSIDEKIELPALIFSEHDFDLIQHYTAKPNFITQKAIERKVIPLQNLENNTIPDIEGNIILLENGDPGYDWIFTRKPAGLITKYGGVASHMSIRCAEFGIPAAIGCGEIIFNQIKNSAFVVLDCKANKIIPRG